MRRSCILVDIRDKLAILLPFPWGRALSKNNHYHDWTVDYRYTNLLLLEHLNSPTFIYPFDLY